MRSLPLLIFILLSNCAVLLAQTHKIDSLKRAVQAAAGQTQKLTAILDLCEEHQSMYKDSLFAYAVTAEQLAAQQGNKRLKNRTLLLKSITLLRKEEADSALAVVNAALAASPITDVANRDVYFKLMEQKANCFGDASNYKDALTLLYQVVNETEKYGDTLSAAINMNTIGVIEYNRDNVPNAFNWYFQGLAMTGSNPRFDLPAAAININLAETYRWVDKPDSAQYFVSRAITQCQRIENIYYLANAYRIQGTIYRNAGKYKEAEQLLLKSIDLRAKTEGDRTYSNETLTLAGFYRVSKQTDKAIQVLKDGLAVAAKADSIRQLSQKGKAKADIIKIYFLQSLATCYKDKGDYKNSVATFEQLGEARDEFYRLNNAEALADVQAQYEVQKKEATIAQQQLDIARKNMLFYGSLGLLVLMALVGYVWFIGYKKRQRLKQTILLENEKRQAEEAERHRISRDLHDNLGAYAASIVSNLDFMAGENQAEQKASAMQELRNNAHAIVSQLNDTIWVLKKDTLSLTNISDRVKVFLLRIQPSYPSVRMNVTEHIQNDLPLPAYQAFHLFRIIQEAVNNALKHSRCHTINITMESNGHCIITIADDGTGMNGTAFPDTGGHGLSNMKSRAEQAGWQIEWLPNQPQGTAVKVQATTN
jgi:signal transduction histidine kinase